MLAPSSYDFSLLGPGHFQNSGFELTFNLQFASIFITIRRLCTTVAMFNMLNIQAGMFAIISYGFPFLRPKHPHIQVRNRGAQVREQLVQLRRTAIPENPTHWRCASVSANRTPKTDLRAPENSQMRTGSARANRATKTD